MYLVLITALVTCRNVNGNESGNINGNINIFNDSNNNIDASHSPLISDAINIKHTYAASIRDLLRLCGSVNNEGVLLVTYVFGDRSRINLQFFTNRF